MDTYRKRLTNGSHFLVNPNLRSEKLIVVEYGGDQVRLTNQGKLYATRGILEDGQGRHFIHNKIKYYLRDAGIN